MANTDPLPEPSEFLRHAADYCYAASNDFFWIDGGYTYQTACDLIDDIRVAHFGVHQETTFRD